MQSSIVAYSKEKKESENITQVPPSEVDGALTSWSASEERKVVRK